MDLRNYMPEGEEPEQVEGSEKNRKSSPKAPIRPPVSGLKQAQKYAPQQEPESKRLAKAADFVTKKQVYEILRNSYRADSQPGVDIGDSNRQMHLEYRKRQQQSEAIEEQAAQRRAQVAAEARGRR